MKSILTLTAALGALAAFPVLAQTPIPLQQGARPVPDFVGTSALAQPIATRPVPDNPFLAAGSWSNFHDDTYMSDTYATAGPLGRSPLVTSTYLGPVPPFPNPDDNTALSAGMVFDGAGRMVAGLIRNDPATRTAWVRLTLMDQASLAVLDTHDLPAEVSTGTDFRPSGTYFYADAQHRTVVGTGLRTVRVLSHATGQFVVEHDWSLTAAIPAGDTIQALQPDFAGRMWFTSKGGVVGTLDMATGTILGWLQLPGERIVNGHAVDETNGAFIASTAAMYRFDADAQGRPTVSWRETYAAGRRVKSGQTDIGTGTTPTLMGTVYVAITDNAQPQMQVVVFRRARVVTGPRLACAVPVFQPGASSNENSLVATDSSIVVENNFGYRFPSTTTHGKTTKSGLARIDLDAEGRGRVVWSNESISIPSVVTKLSLGTGLIHTYTKPRGPANTDAWYFTAVDFHTGEVVWSKLAGTGALYNNHYSAMFLGPNGTLYVGVLGGIVTLRDTF
ncbi:MAG: hypothetical protein RIT25_2601 [Planctomycetota bacterium]